MQRNPVETRPRVGKAFVVMRGLSQAAAPGERPRLTAKLTLSGPRPCLEGPAGLGERSHARHRHAGATSAPLAEAGGGRPGRRMAGVQHVLHRERLSKSSPTSPPAPPAHLLERRISAILVIGLTCRPRHRALYSSTDLGGLPAARRTPSASHDRRSIQFDRTFFSSPLRTRGEGLIARCRAGGRDRVVASGGGHRGPGLAGPIAA